MKLLLYSKFFAPSVGGVETVLVSLARGLAERDARDSANSEVTLVTQTAAGKCDDSVFPFRVVRRPGLFQLCRLTRSSDVIHIAGPALAPIILGLLARRPVVVEHHGFQTICPNGQLFIEPKGMPCPGHFMAGRHTECLRCNCLQGWLASWKLWLLTFLRRFLCAQVAANIVPTQWLGGLLRLPHVTPIPHGVDAGLAISPAAPTSNVPGIAFMGRLVTTKGVHVLLKAAKILFEQNRIFELLIIGQGPERAALEQFVRESQLATKVRFAGHLYEVQLEAALAQTATVVVPSLGGEVFGMVIAENMARGLPVVASDLGAFVEVLGGTGLTFRNGDAANLAAVLSRLLDDPATATNLGSLARQRALDFYNRSRMIEEHSRVYRALCETTKG